jgi:peptide deformylase
MKIENSQLKNRCKDVDFTNPKKNLKLAHELLRLMAKERGIGLAANQCGYDQRVFVMSVNQKYYHCFNPEIIESSTEQDEYKEGCLSFPGEFCTVTRPLKIQVKYFSAQGQETVEWLDGLTARCFQHELDHLNGLTMFDK